MASISENLETDLVEVINRHIKSEDLSPQVAAVTMNKMTIEFLDCLSWKPQDVQCAEILLSEAQKWLHGANGTPVLSHSGDADEDVLKSLITPVKSCSS